MKENMGFGEYMRERELLGAKGDWTGTNYSGKWVISSKMDYMKAVIQKFCY